MFYSVNRLWVNNTCFMMLCKIILHAYRGGCISYNYIIDYLHFYKTTSIFSQGSSVFIRFTWILTVRLSSKFKELDRGGVHWPRRRVASHFPMIGNSWQHINRHNIRVQLVRACAQARDFTLMSYDLRKNKYILTILSILFTGLYEIQ